MVVKVKGPYSVSYKGKLYTPGEKLDMDKAEAERLIKKGIVEMSKQKEEK